MEDCMRASWPPSGWARSSVRVEVGGGAIAMLGWTMLIWRSWHGANLPHRIYRGSGRNTTGKGNRNFHASRRGALQAVLGRRPPRGLRAEITRHGTALGLPRRPLRARPHQRRSGIAAFKASVAGRQGPWLRYAPSGRSKLLTHTDAELARMAASTSPHALVERAPRRRAAYRRNHRRNILAPRRQDDGP